MSQIIGVVYPILPQFVDRIFLQKRNVFVKYLPRSNTKIQSGHKTIFYVSHGSKEIVGEGKVESVEFLTPDEAWQKYGDKIFLSQKELQEYTISQPTRSSTKKMLVLTLIELKKYEKAIKYPRSVTMAGEYIRKADYKLLMRDCR